MKILGLDASVDAGAAVVDAGVVLGAAAAGSGARPAAQLVPLVAAALAHAGLDRRAVDALAVGVGPGSYAGVRAAVATAKAWAWAAGLPLAAVDSLQALALAAGPWRGPVWAVLDARNGHVFAGEFSCGGDGVPRPVAPAQLMPGAELASRIAGAAAPVLVAGAAGPWAGECRLAGGAIPGIAAAVARLGALHADAGTWADPLTLVPRYLRPPQLGRPAAGR